MRKTSCLLILVVLFSMSIVAAHPEVHPPYDVTIEPDTVTIAPPKCSASFVAHVTMDYHEKPITILIDERSEGDWKGPGTLISSLYDGRPTAPSSTENYDTTITIGVVSPWEKPAGSYRVRVCAYPDGENPFTNPAYAVLTVVIVDTGIETCEQPPDGGGATTIYTTGSWTYATTAWTYTTTPPDWWDWWHWWDWWNWFKWGTFDFALNATPTSQSIKAGESATFTVGVILVSGAPRPVTLTLSELPNNIYYSFSPSSGPPSFTSSLRISCDASLSPGTYQLAIIGAGGDKTHSIVVNLIVARNMTESSISISMTPPSVREGEAMSAGGALSPAVQTTVELVYTRPDGFEMVKHLTTTPGGVFSDSYSPDAPGLWSVRARWPGDENYYGCESQPASFSVQEKPPSFLDFLPTIGLIIIIAVAILVAAMLVRRRSSRRSAKAKLRTEFCPKCKVEISMEHDYCPECGQKIR